MKNMKLIVVILVGFLPNIVNAQTIVFNLGLDSLNLPCIVQTTFDVKSGKNHSWNATAGQHVDKFGSCNEALAAAKMLQSKMVSDSIRIRGMMDENTAHLKQLGSIISELERMQKTIVPGYNKME